MSFDLYTVLVQTFKQVELFSFTKQLQEIWNFETRSFILIPDIILDTLMPQTGEF